MVEGFAIEDAFGRFYADSKAHAVRTTYGWFVGFDQTNEKGFAGSARLGHRYRDVGRMPSHVTTSDGVNTAQGVDTTIPLDFSGLYVKLGLGFDLVR